MSSYPYYLPPAQVERVVDGLVDKYMIPLLSVEPLPFKRSVAAIVVCDRNRPVGDGFVVYARLVNPTNIVPERDYLAFAYAKALFAARTGMSSFDVVKTRPDLIRRGDFAHPGAGVYGYRIVSISGLDGLEDHVFQGAINLALDAALWTSYAERPQGVYFVGEDPQLAGQLPEALDLSELEAFRPKI